MSVPETARMRVETRSLPQVTMIVPIAGVSANLERQLLSLLQQAYPAYRVIFVTQDEQDPAVPVIRRVLIGKTDARHINAGRAEACGQKNHNLLQGVRASDQKTDILVFCDSGHLAHPEWLEQLISPLHDPSIAVSSGYHHVFPDTRCVCSIGRAICVLALHQVRKIPIFAQPWGGATAIRAADFKELGIAELWSASIVDDVILADHLQKKRMTVAIPPGADLKTELEDRSVEAWEAWLIRQWAYLKFVFPGLWLSAGLAGLAFTILVYVCIVIVLAWYLRIFSLQYMRSAAVFLVTLMAGMLLFRSRHPEPGSVFFWFPAFLAALFMAGWCHCRTWFSNSITWSGIVYKVGAGGKVVEIIRPEVSGVKDGEA